MWRDGLYLYGKYASDVWRHRNDIYDNHLKSSAADVTQMFYNVWNHANYCLLCKTKLSFSNQDVKSLKT
jgi:hypothetical protein